MMRCALCGFEFDQTQMACHASCALNAHCAVICCPNCGHQTVDESASKVAQGVRRLMNRVARRGLGAEQATGKPIRLSELWPGQSATVISVESQNSLRLERLSVYGVVPGCQLTLEQRQPTFVARVGFTELSFERDVADEMLVQPQDTVP
jgi:Fe2+ transport system protein FeoA